MPRQQPRRVARELALLAWSQVRPKAHKLGELELEPLVSGAVRTLVAEVQETLETAAGEIQRAQERLLSSTTRAQSADSAREMTAEAIALTQGAINRLGVASELPEFVQVAGGEEVRQYALTLLSAIATHREAIDATLDAAMEGWQLSRVPQLDRTLLRIAVAEMQYLDVPVRVAINEAVELGKRYSDEEGYRFINGVLRRVDRRAAHETSREDAPQNATQDS